MRAPKANPASEPLRRRSSPLPDRFTVNETMPLVTLPAEFLTTTEESPAMLVVSCGH
jgi:hypothetical protein